MLCDVLVSFKRIVGKRTFINQFIDIGRRDKRWDITRRLCNSLHAWYKQNHG